VLKKPQDGKELLNRLQHICEGGKEWNCGRSGRGRVGQDAQPRYTGHGPMEREKGEEGKKKESLQSLKLATALEEN